MKSALLFVVQIVAFAVSLVAAQRCPTRRGICVESKYCHDSGAGKTPFKCRTSESKELGVCCGVSKITLGTNCLLEFSNKRHPGKCAPASSCSPFRIRGSKSDVWRTWNKECNGKQEEDHYCCPEKLLIKLDSTKLAAVSNNKTINIDVVNRNDFATTQLFSQNVFPTCQTPDAQNGHCVPFQMCDRLYNLFRQGVHVANRTVANSLYKSKCPSTGVNSTSICCPTPADLSALILHDKASRLGLERCGPVAVDDKVLNGDKAGLGNHPWMANLMYRVVNNRTLLVSKCSGSLIHPSYVLTAAHCRQASRGFIPVAVRLGEYDLSKEIDCEQGECAEPYKEYAIAKWMSHFSYKLRKPDHDIALIQLKAKATLLLGHIFPICLPLAASLLMLKPKQSTVTGWGQMESDVLLKADLVHHLENNSEVCRRESIFCARGVERGGHCRGDSGSPLQVIMPLRNTYRTVLFGIVLGKIAGCAVDEKKPRVSVLVGYHIHWILDNMSI